MAHGVSFLPAESGGKSECACLSGAVEEEGGVASRVTVAAAWSRGRRRDRRKGRGVSL